MNAGEILRDAAARRHALEQYASAHDVFEELEQLYILEGRDIEAAGAHEYALTALRAYRAELDDVRPEGMDG